MEIQLQKIIQKLKQLWVCLCCNWFLQNKEQLGLTVSANSIILLDVLLLNILILKSLVSNVFM